MRLPVRAPHLSWCDKIDDMLFSSKTPNSYDALRSKRHATNRTVPQKRKAPLKREAFKCVCPCGLRTAKKKAFLIGKLSNASACAGSAPVKV